MFKIKVLKRGKVILGDLNLVLKHGDVLDLDERFPRAHIEGSANLKSATMGDDPAIAILHKDVIVERSTDTNALSAMEQRIKDSIVAHMKAHPNSDSVTQQLAALVSALQNGTVQPSSSAPVDSTEQSLHDDKLIDIHTRAMKRLTKDTEGHVSAEKQDIKSDAAERAKDLEDMF